MLINLIAPSEAKQHLGIGSFKSSSLFLKELHPLRDTLIKEYKRVIKGDESSLHKLFGIKNSNEVERYKSIDLLGSPTLLAIERYSGVAFNYIDYQSLTKDAKDYIQKHTIIFSNLFGPILAGDTLPDYRLTQGASLGNIRPEVEYRKIASPLLDNFLEGKDILDLRANFYEKFYKPSHFYTKLKFLKSGRVVSHWAKAYRGLVLRHIALNNIETIDDFLSLAIPSLTLIEIREYKRYQEIIYNIDDE